MSVQITVIFEGFPAVHCVRGVGFVSGERVDGRGC